MTKKENKEVKLNIRLTENLRQQYKQYCLEHNLDMSKHIREFIEKTVNK
jgi:antitoxin component of RelBE/YafQ-DinJ toxin-antitoxin module